MIRSVLSRLTVALTLATCASLANATPVTFAISGGSATVSGVAFGSSVDVATSANLAHEFQLEEGQSHTFEFLDVTVAGIGIAVGTVQAALDFAQPSSQAVGELGGFAGIFGIVSAGALAVLDQPDSIAFGNGGLFDVRFQGTEDMCTFCTSLRGTVMATVELLKAPVAVPEPSTLALLGVGLLSLRLLRRRSAQ